MTNTNSSFANKVAVVCGGSRGLGRGAVEALAGRGARVLAIARNEAELGAMAREVPGAVAIAGDAADEPLATRLLDKEDPDLVVLCAGAAPRLAPLHEQTWEEFSANWQVDTKGTFVWLRQILRRPMKRGAHVIVISSGAAAHGSPVSGGYAPAKRAQWFMAEYAAAEVERAGLGIRVHCVLPALNAGSAMGRAAIAAYAQRAGVTPEEFAKRFAPPLTPAIFGEAIAELFAAPERFDKLAYRLGGGGLAPLG